MSTVPTTPRPAMLAHIVLRTGRFDKVVEWWKTVLQCDVRHQNDFLSFLSFDEEHHRLAILRRDDVGDDGRSHAGLEHVAFTYASLADLVATYERLRDLGIVPVLPINHGMTLSMYYADPDGNQVELQIDLGTLEEAEAFMASSAFAANPLGVPFDPEQMVAQFHAGEPVDALTLHGPGAHA